MFNCNICSKLIIISREFQNHVKYIHNFSEVNFKSQICSYRNCDAQINTWSGYMRHIKSHDSNANEINNNNLGLDLEIVSQIPDFQNEVVVDESCETENFSVELGINLLVKQLGEFCSNLVASGINNSIVDLIVRELKHTMLVLKIIMI